MKKITFSLLLATVLLSCSTGTLHSVTYIEPGLSFALGEGKHGGYSASITNQGKSEIVVSALKENGMTLPLDTLKISQSGKYQVPANTQVFFKNTSTANQGEIKILLKGDTNLSMNYEGKK